MGYLHIDNLYKDQKILQFRECYALEKVHGTSAHIKFERLPGDGTGTFEPVPDVCKLTFYSGGASHITFIGIFDHEALKTAFLALGAKELTVFGEAYGGKMQGMRDTYGDQLRFIAFDVLNHEERWSGVEGADFLCQKLGLEFVPYRKISTDLASLDAERDLPSRVAVRRGITEPRIAEGIVLRPPVEVFFNNGGRFISKHKRSEFSERTSKRDTTVDPEKAIVLSKAEAIAEEWVTPMRMEHVLDKLTGTHQREMVTQDTRIVIDAMIEDVTREAKDEIVASREAIRAISTSAGKLFKKVQLQRLERNAP